MISIGSLLYTFWLVAVTKLVKFFYSFHVDSSRRNYYSSNNVRLYTESLRYIPLPVLPSQTHPVPTVQVVVVSVGRSHFVFVCTDCCRIAWRSSRREQPQPSGQGVQFSTAYLIVGYSSFVFTVLKQRGYRNITKNWDHIWLIGGKHSLLLFTPVYAIWEKITARQANSILVPVFWLMRREKFKRISYA